MAIANSKLYSEAIIGLVGNLVNLGIWQYNMERDHLQWDEVMFRIYDVDPKDFKHTFRFWHDLVHPDDVEQAASSFQESVKNNGEFIYTFRILDSKKNIRWIKANALISEVNPQGERIIIGANQDITSFVDIKEEQESLMDTLKDSQHTARIGSWQYFPKTNVSVMDEITKDIYGLGPQDHIPASKGITFYKEGWSRETIVKAFADLLQKQTPYDLELPMINARGEEIWVRTIGKAKANSNGEVVKTSGVFQDVTEHKRRESELIESQRRFRAAFDHSAIGMALMALNGAWLKPNTALIELLGYSETELLQLDFQSLTVEADLVEEIILLEKCIQGKIDSYRLDKRFVKKDGSTLWVLLNVSMVKSVDDEALYLIAQIEDINDRKIHERELEEANKKLKQLTNRLIIQNRSLNDFAHIASHNLRAPVANLMLLNELYGSTEEAASKDEIFEMVSRSTEDLQKTLDQLVDALIIKNKRGMDMQQLTLKQLVDGVNQKLQQVILSSNTEIDYDLQVDSLFANAVYMESILINLIGNSIKYKHPQRQAKIAVKAWESEKGLHLSVSDNGLGIDLKRHGRKMFGLNKTFHKNSNANGVGLFMVKSQVEAMNGSISVESEPNVGSTFTIVFRKSKKTWGLDD